MSPTFAPCDEAILSLRNSDPIKPYQAAHVGITKAPARMVSWRHFQLLHFFATVAAAGVGVAAGLVVPLTHKHSIFRGPQSQQRKGREIHEHYGGIAY